MLIFEEIKDYNFAMKLQIRKLTNKHGWLLYIAKNWASLSTLSLVTKYF